MAAGAGKTGSLTPPASSVSVNPAGLIVLNGAATVQAALAQIDSMLAGTPTYEFGLIAARPDPATRHTGSTYWASDDGPNGTLYQRTNTGVWQATGNGGVGAGQEIAYIESNTAFNVTAAAGTGSAPGTYKDVTGMVLTVPAGQNYYIEVGAILSLNASGLSGGKTGIGCRIEDVSAAGNAAGGFVEFDIPLAAAAAGSNIATAVSVMGSRRIANPGVAKSWKLTAAITGYGSSSTQPSGFLAQYVYAGSGYPPMWMRARAT